jgi:hypothetical protein
MVHAALLLLMLEAVHARPRFTISLKRSTQNLQLSTSRRPITPSLGHSATFLPEKHMPALPPITTEKADIDYVRKVPIAALVLPRMLL